VTRLVRHGVPCTGTLLRPMEPHIKSPLESRRDDVDLYARTYSTVLRTSGDVHLRAFERAHLNMGRPCTRGRPRRSSTRAR